MNTKSLPLSAAAAAVLAAAIVVVSMAAQAPQSPQAAATGAAQSQPLAPPAGGPGGRPREFPAPTNLKVLPKTLTGKQVRDVMEGWSGSLGVHCDTCHTKDPGRVGPNGRPALNFADDSKHEKQAARLMYTMTRKINADYISMVDMEHEEHEHEGQAGHEDHAGQAGHEAHEHHGDHNVTCGTCHRGHQQPEAYIPPKEHDRPPAPAGQPPLPR